MSADDGKSPKPTESGLIAIATLADTLKFADTLKIAESPDPAETLKLAEPADLSATLKTAEPTFDEPPKTTAVVAVADLPKVMIDEPPPAFAPFKRRENAKVRLRENVVSLRASLPPAQWIPAAKPRTTGSNVRRIAGLCIVTALIAYALLFYLRMRTVAEVNRAVQHSANKSTDTL